ncbi:DUF2974 domain-containing protein, partial [bacterium]|nr:DUF2974 domain-containing protein [bacterium]
MFEHKINTELLKLALITYGGKLYFGLKNHIQKELDLSNTNLKKIEDILLAKSGETNFFCYKNPDSGFAANLFEDTKTQQLVIAYRGTERPGLGENENDINTTMKDVSTDLNLVTGVYDEQFKDAWDFYKTVKAQNPKKKIIIIGQSLGGALAQITAAKEYTINRIKVETYTYNAPGCAHLLDLYSCKTDYDYKFITNYAVMND